MELHSKAGFFPTEMVPSYQHGALPPRRSAKPDWDVHCFQGGTIPSHHGEVTSASQGEVSFSLHPGGTHHQSGIFSFHQGKPPDQDRSSHQDGGLPPRRHYTRVALRPIFFPKGRVEGPRKITDEVGKWNVRAYSSG